MTYMAGKHNIKKTVRSLIKNKKIKITKLSVKEKDELKERIKFTIRQVQGGEA